MTINDQIRDKKLQYIINKEAAKISALSSDKFCKYEYLTAKEILPSNQQQIIEQAKFTYSLLGKAFEKQIKTIEDQGEKQVEALKDLKDHREQLVNVNVNDDYEDKLLHSKERKIFRNIYSLIKQKNYVKKIDDNNLVFTTLSTGKTTDFSKKNDPFTFLNKIKKGEITIEEAKESQKDFNKHLKMIRRGNKNHEQEKTLANINMFFSGINNAINFIDSMILQFKMILEARKRAAEEQD